jgi:signal transduction histidine kinase
MTKDEEDQLLRSVVRQNAESIFLARQRAERELLEAKEALEAKTAELAASLAMMQATLESTADGILVTDEAGSVTGFNETFVRMWDLPAGVMASRDHRRLLDVMARQVPDPDDFLAEVAAIDAGSRPDTFDVLSLVDGRVFERCTRVQLIDGRVVGRVWSYRDVTERARSEAALREAKTQAEAANRAKSAFLTMMSHELRTPLNAIAGYAQLLELEIHGALNEAQRQPISRIQSSQKHLLRLIDDVLTHAKLETGTIEYELRPVPVADVIAAAEALVAPQAQARDLTIEVRGCPPDLVARADEERLRQILANLLSNAVKFTDPGGRIEIACDRVESEVRIAVRDSGIGISEDALEDIFVPFMQVRSELTRATDGTGLGLPISRSLARGMGGDVIVESNPGSGSTFFLVLPAA